MAIEIFITSLLLIAGVAVLLQLYDFFESETVRMLLIAAYGLFFVFMLFRLFAEYIFMQLGV